MPKSYKPYGPPASVTWLQLLRKQTKTNKSTTLTEKNTLIYEHATWRNLSNCGICLWLLTLNILEVGDFGELILLYETIFIW